MSLPVGALGENRQCYLAHSLLPTHLLKRSHAVMSLKQESAHVLP